MGRNPWGDEATYRSIASRFWKGASFKATSITENYTFETLRENNSHALFLFCVQQGRLVLLGDTDTPPPPVRR